MTMLLLVVLLTGGLFTSVLAVPIFVCSWQLTTESPELYGYDWFCDADKQSVNASHAQYMCNGRHWDQVADLGFVEPTRDLLRFRKSAASGSLAVPMLTLSPMRDQVPLARKAKTVMMATASRMKRLASARVLRFVWARTAPMTASSNAS